MAPAPDVERLAKPAAMVGLLSVALLAGATDSTPGAGWCWRCVLGLVGDVLLLEDTPSRFVGGLAAFLVGHLAYVASFVAVGLDRPALGWLGAAVLLVALVVGRRILPGALAQGGAALGACRRGLHGGDRCDGRARLGDRPAAGRARREPVRRQRHRARDGPVRAGPPLDPRRRHGHLPPGPGPDRGRPAPQPDRRDRPSSAEVPPRNIPLGVPVAAAWRLTPHHASHTHAAAGGSWSGAARATLHCLTGCAIGEILGLVIGTALGLSTGATIVLAIALAFVFGYALTLTPVLRSGVALKAALAVTLAADTVSITVMELVDNSVVLVIPGAMDAGLTSTLFWGSLAASLAVAFVLTVPVNRWLISRGRGHAVVHGVPH